MNCPEVRDSSESYIAADLDDVASGRVAEHLKSCATCAAAYEETRLLVGDLKELRTARRSSRVVEGVMEVAGRAAPERDCARRGRSWARAWVAVAAALTLALIGSVVPVTVPSLARTVPLPVGQRLADLERDNGSHKVEKASRRAAENDVESASTPFHASWLNRIEAQFRAWRSFTFAGTDPSRPRHPSSPDPPLHRLAQPEHRRRAPASSRQHGKGCLTLHEQTRWRQRASLRVVAARRPGCAGS